MPDELARERVRVPTGRRSGRGVRNGLTSYDVLISYAPADVEDAEWVAAALREAELSVFFDRETLAPGESGEDAVVAALRDSDCVVEVIGRSGFESLGRLDLFSLISKADRSDLPVVAVLLPSLPSGTTPPSWLSDYQALDLRSYDQESGQARQLLIEAVTGAGRLGPGSSEPAPFSLPGHIATISGEMTAGWLAAALLPHDRLEIIQVITGVGGRKATVEAWLRRARQLLDLDDKALGDQAPLAMTFALALSEPALWDVIADAGYLNELQRAIPVPVTTILTPAGRERYAALDRPPAAGYRPDDLLGADMLDVTPDVNALCDVVMSTDVAPPLSIGLFAEWGAGKSFFMRQMRDRVDELRDRARTATAAGQPAYWCADVIQITFNAWHYIDANLWASLAARMFEELDGGKSARRTALVRQLGSLQQTEQLARAAVNEATAERAAKAAQLAELEAKKTSVDSSLSEVSGVELAKTIASDPELRSQARDVASELGLPKDARLEELGQAVSDLSDLSNQVVKVWRLLGRSRHAWRRRGLVLGLAAAIGTLAWFLTTHAAAPGIVALGSLAVALGSVARTVSAVARPGSTVIQRAQDFFASAEQKEKEAEQARADREKALQNELAQLNVAIAQKQAQLDRDTFQLGQVKAKFGPGDNDAARFYERVLGGFASDDYRDRLGVVSAIQRDFEQLARLLPEGKFNGLPKVDRIILYIDDLDRCSAEQVVQVLQAVHLLLAFPLFVVVVGVDLRWLMRSLRVHHAALAAADAATVDAPGGELAGLAATPQAYLEKIFQIPFRLRPMDPAGSAKLLADLLPVTPRRDHGETESGERAPEERGTADGGRPAAPATEATASASPAASTTPVPSPPPVDIASQSDANAESAATTTELDLPPRSMRLEPRELEFLQQLVPLIPTPRAVKRLANEYRLVRATIPDSRLAAFLDVQYPVVMFLLALLVGRPQVAERLLATLRRPAEPDDSPLSVDEVLSRSAADRPDPAVRDAARLLPPGDPVTVMRQWASYVARFSFYVSD